MISQPAPLETCVDPLLRVHTPSCLGPLELFNHLMSQPLCDIRKTTYQYSTFTINFNNNYLSLFTSPFVIMGGIVSSLTHLKSTPIDEKSSQPLDPNAALASKLRGKTIHVDMTKSFPHWPSGTVHPEYRRLQRECDRALEMYSPHQ